MYGLSGLIDPPITGWLQVFFPYLADGHRSTGLKEYIKSYKNGVSLDNYRASAKHFREPDKQCGNGTKLEDFPTGLSSAPFTYNDIPADKKYDMKFYGGIVSLVQHADGSLEPLVGWAVIEKKKTEPEQAGVGADRVNDQKLLDWVCGGVLEPTD